MLKVSSGHLCILCIVRPVLWFWGHLVDVGGEEMGRVFLVHDLLQDLSCLEIYQVC